MDNHRSLKNWLLSAGMIFVALSTYTYPAIKTTATTGSHVLPPISAPDVSLYLNISNIKAASAGEVTDPYYGIAVPVARMGYLKFRLAFLLFGKLSALLHGDLWWTLLVWNLFWWSLLCALALWFFQEFLPDRTLPDRPIEVALVGLAALMFLNFGALQGQFSAWIHLPSPRGFQSQELPYIRPFFPQVPIPLLILYLGLQIKALENGRWRVWAATGITQLLAFAIFPYATLMMAGISAVGGLGCAIGENNVGRARKMAVYAIACGLGDLLFFFHSGGVTRTGAPIRYSLIHIQPSVLAHRIGGMWLMLAVLTALVFFVRNSPPEVRWSAIGLGLSNLFLLSGDAFFSETALQVSHHGGYFVQATATLLFLFLLSAGTRHLVEWKRAWRLILGAVTLLLTVNGMLVAHATYTAFLPPNQEQAELAQFLRSNQQQTNDLVFAGSAVVDDDCAWVPLVSSSHVLFCRSAQVLLSPEQNQQIQRFRQALYLYFTGKDGSWLQQVLDDPNDTRELTRLTFLGQLTTNIVERQQAIDAVRKELLPLLIRAANNDPEVRAFLSHYRRVLVVDNADRPLFAVPRLVEYLTIEKQQTFGHLLVFSCSPQER